MVSKYLIEKIRKFTNIIINNLAQDCAIGEKVFALRARPLSSHRKWGDDLAKNADFQTRRFNLVCHVIFFRAARGLYHLIILTKMIILNRATNACLQNCAWRRIQQKMANSILRNYFMHGYKLLNAVFTEMKTS